ncbi:MAG: hypothetical protein IJ874_08815 [Ruminococcus sp.]|nr:hypothetical protein [Ruminococcus sp.]
MKKMNNNDELRTRLTGLDDSTVEEIAERYPVTDEETKRRIMKRFLEKTENVDSSSKMQTINGSDEDSVSGTDRIEQVKWRSWVRYAGAAAAFIIAVCGIGGVIAISRNDLISVPGSESDIITEQVQTESTSQEPAAKQTTIPEVYYYPPETDENADDSGETLPEPGTEPVSVSNTTAEVTEALTSTVTTAAEETVTTAAENVENELSESDTTEPADEPVKKEETVRDRYDEDPVAFLTGNWLTKTSNDDDSYTAEYQIMPCTDGTADITGVALIRLDAESGIGKPFTADIDGCGLVFRFINEDETIKAEITSFSISESGTDSFELMWDRDTGIGSTLFERVTYDGYYDELTVAEE